NLPLYETLSKIEGLNITASGGISSLYDLKALKTMNLYGAILGKAMYTGAVVLEDAISVVSR
ncbi:MAG: HisA/HisF-related TIM barrel protein, partial [Oribacterium sp.]|nr:HisA/HisF-related TIM barrel protein [Oribacterium sp.]